MSPKAAKPHAPQASSPHDAMPLEYFSPNTAPKPRFLRFPTVIDRVGLPRPTIYRKIAEGKFPRGINLDGRSVCFLESDIDEWMNERIQARDAAKRPDADEVA